MEITDSSFKYLKNLKYPDKTVLSFTDGTFKDVEFYIEKISLDEDKQTEKLTISYDFEVVSEQHKHLETNKELQQQIGDLVVYFLTSYDKIIGSNDKNTTRLSDSSN